VYFARFTLRDLRSGCFQPRSAMSQVASAFAEGASACVKGKFGLSH
jgi:hypothetical protein